jgi:hypothetical protein
MPAEMGLKAELPELKLYIANGTPNSALALRNIQMIIDEHLPGSYTM